MREHADRGQPMRERRAGRPDAAAGPQRWRSGRWWVRSLWQRGGMLPSHIATVDYHTGGEPFRIVAEPPVPIAGATVAEGRARAIESAEVQAL